MKSSAETGRNPATENPPAGTARVWAPARVPPPPLVYTSSARSSFPAPLLLVRERSPPTQLPTVTLSAAPLLRPPPADRSGACTNFSPTAVLASHQVRRHFTMSLGRQCQASILLNGKSTITFTRKVFRLLLTFQLVLTYILFSGHAVAAMKPVPVVAALALVIAAVTSASPSTGYWAFKCDGGNYTMPSKYLQSIEEMAIVLPGAASSSPSLSHTEFVGSNQEDRVYALATCRGDTEANNCKKCLTQAFQDARAVCRFRKSVSIYYDTCSLGFSEKNIRFHPENLQAAYRADGPQVPVQCKKEFNKAASAVISDVARKAVDARYASGKENLDEHGCRYKLVYGFAECSPQLPHAQCQLCLEDLTAQPGLSGNVGERKATLWCSYRFEPSQFFKSSKGGHRTLWIVVGVVGGAVTIALIALIFLLWWRMPAKRPSAIDFFDAITVTAEGKMIALFLDYDGTLSPIVKIPEEAFMSEEMRDAVGEAASLFPTSVVTGRSRDKVKDFIQLENLHYAGSHGMDIKLSDETEAFQPTSEYEPRIAEATERLEDVVQQIKGAMLENNKYCVSVHYRNVHKKERKLVKDLVNRTLTSFSDLKVTRGKKVLEVRPKADFNKGHAVNYLLEYLVNKNNWDRSQVLAIYIGDDKTDEDAFKVLSGQGGFGILVSKKRRKTDASYSLKDPPQVKEFLQKLVSWKSGEAQV
ncbi:hypothetical protein ACQ4PT_030830 [Festuca glaucescens]